MKAFFQTVTCFLIAATMSLGLFSSQAWALGNFSQSCYDSFIDGSVLSSTCRRINGSYMPTSIDLNPVIENVDGELEWQPSNFIETCDYAQLASPSIMIAECKTRSQELVPTFVDLDEHIANIDGTLMFE